MRTLFTKRVFAALLGLAPVLVVQPAWAVVQYCTISEIQLSGFFGGVTGGGSFTEGTSLTSSVTVTESTLYTYTFTGPLNGPGYTEKSQQPPTLCVIAGCVPGTTIPSTYANLEHRMVN
jgi:hypothetical protein